MKTKHITLTALLAASMLMGGANDVNAQKPNRYQTDVDKTFTLPKTMALGDNDLINFPDTIKYYNYDPEGDCLKLYFLRYLEYADDGSSIIEKGYFPDYVQKYRVNYLKFDDHGMMTENIGGESEDSFDNIYFTIKNCFAYEDAVLPELNTMYLTYVNEETEAGVEPVWNLNMKSWMVINRDDKDRITKFEGNTQMGAESIAKVRTKTENTYTDGVGPTNIKFYDIDFSTDKLVVQTEYDDLEWAECDNQIMTRNEIEQPECPPFALKNKLLKGTIKNYSDYSSMIKFNYTYDEKGRATSCNSTFYDNDNNIGDVQLNEFNYIEHNDSITVDNNTTILQDLNNDGNIDVSERVLELFVRQIYDKNMRLVYTGEFSTDEYGEFIENRHKRTEYTDDGMGRTVEQRIYLMNAEEGIPDRLFSKIVYHYGDNPTGIASVNSENVALKVRGHIVSFTGAKGRYMVCNADGRLVMSGSAAEGWLSLDNLPNGLYIVKVNGCAVKVIR